MINKYEMLGIYRSVVYKVISKRKRYVLIEISVPATIGRVQFPFR